MIFDILYRFPRVQIGNDYGAIHSSSDHQIRLLRMKIDMKHHA